MKGRIWEGWYIVAPSGRNPAVNGVYEIEGAPIADARCFVGRNVRRIDCANRRMQRPAARGQRHVPAGSIGRLMAGDTAANDVQNFSALDVGGVMRQLSGGQRLGLRQEDKRYAAEAQKNRGR